MKEYSVIGIRGCASVGKLTERDLSSVVGAVTYHLSLVGLVDLSLQFLCL